MSRLLLLTLCLSLSPLLHAELPPKVEKYLKALETRPLNESLIQRFLSEWEMERTGEELLTYMKEVPAESWQQKVIYAQIATHHGDSTQAMQWYEEALNECPTPEPLHLKRGLILMEKYEFKEAI